MKRILSIAAALAVLLSMAPMALATESGEDATVTQTLLEATAVTTNYDEAWDGISYTFTAPGTGDITVNLFSGDVAPQYQFSINGEPGDWVNCASAVAYSQSFEVSQGDSIELIVCMLDTSMVTYCGGSVDVNVVFTGVISSGGSAGEGESGGDNALIVGDNNIAIESGETLSPSYTWTPTADGTMTIAVTALVSTNMTETTSYNEAEIAGWLEGGSVALLVNGESYTGPVAVTAGVPVTVQLQQGRLNARFGWAWTAVINLAFEAAAEDVLYGDVNGDGNVDNLDATAILQHAAGWSVELNAAAGDVNDDGNVDNLDATAILQYAAGWEVALGPDETAE